MLRIHTDLSALLVIADGAFPTGGFAHSFGLETAIDEGRVRDEASATVWIRSYLEDALATADGAALLLALAEREPLATLDRALAAATFAPEARDAQRRLALALCAAFAALDLGSHVDAYREAIATGYAYGHCSLVYALAFRALGIDPYAAFVTYATATVGTLVSAATRAVPLGQRAALHVRWSLRPAIESAFARARAISRVDELHAQAYVSEIDAMRHARLDGRMFAS